MLLTDSVILGQVLQGCPNVRGSCYLKLFENPCLTFAGREIIKLILVIAEF
jgi:hypothetical protein